MRENSAPVSDIVFQILFESAPGLYLAVNPDFRIVAASNAYLRATMTERSSLIGQDILEAVPRNSDDPSSFEVRSLRASLCRVLQDKVPDAMAVQQYDVRRPDSEGGGIEERFWSPWNYPVLDSENNVLYIIYWIDDVTDTVGSLKAPHHMANIAVDPANDSGCDQQTCSGERLQRIGTLARGIANNLSNILISKMIGVQLPNEILNGATVQPLLSELEANAVRSAAIVERLLTFAQPVELPEVSVPAKIQSILPMGNNELVLIVDDEPVVLDITKTTLEFHKYRVLEAKDGAEALTCYAQRSEEIRVVLLDMTMPVMDGFDTIRFLEGLNPNVKIIASSQDDNSKSQGRSLRDAGKSVRAVLAKPYTADSLLRTLHDVIGTE